MSPAHQPSAPWNAIGKKSERITARPEGPLRGLLATGLTLLGEDGEEIGHLKLRGSAGASLVVGGLEAVIERDGRGYRMLASGTEVLSAIPQRGGALLVRCAGREYGIEASPVRNCAVARSPEGTVAASVSGGLLGRSYEVSPDPGDGWAFPISVLLLYHLLTVRRHAFLAGLRR